MHTRTKKYHDAADDLADVQLLEKIAAGDRLALRKFYFLYHRRLQRFLTTVSSDTLMMEEIINDTLLAVWRSAASFRGDSRVSTWVFGVAYRRALKTLQCHANHHAGQVASAVEDGGAAIDAVALDFERSNWIDTALGQLSVEHRMVVELTYYAGLSCEEVSAITDCPVGTVKTRLHHARIHLRRALQDLALPAARFERANRSAS
jgi:RNA polymerase sigma-70 factor (ECF subfamily)